MNREVKFVFNKRYIQCIPSHIGAVPSHSPFGLLPSPSHVLMTSSPLRPNPESQMYVALVLKSNGAVVSREKLISPLDGFRRSSQVMAVTKQRLNVTTTTKTAIHIIMLPVSYRHVHFAAKVLRLDNYHMTLDSFYTLIYLHK